MRLLSVLTVLLIAATPLGTSRAARLALACGSVGIEATLCRQSAEAWARQTGNTVDLVSTPSGSSARLALLQQLLAARSADIDVFQIDIVWPGMLAAHLLDLAGRVPPARLDATFPALVAANTVAGRLVALPWFTSAGLLYYRRDLLAKHHRPVPQTWAALQDTAAAIMQAERQAGTPRIWGYVFQARAYEGLTANALEWLDSHAAGRIVSADGRITVANPKAEAALAQAAAWVGTIAPKGVLNYAEEEARGVFQTGDAVFMRNWPYAWPLLNAPDSPVRGRVGIAMLPRGSDGGHHSATLGGEGLAISRYTNHPDEAASLLLHLTRRAAQKQRAIAAGFNPTLPDLYLDPDVLAANPFYRDLAATFANAVARPSVVTGPRYNQVSAEFWNAVHSVLAGRATAEDALARLDRTLHRVSRGEKW